MKKRIVIYSLLVIIALISYKLNNFYKQEGLRFAIVDSCTPKGCEYDLYHQTAKLFLEKELSKINIKNFEYEIAESTVIPYYKFKIKYKSDNVVINKIVWLKKESNRYVWRIVFIGENDSDFFKSIQV